LVVLLAMPALFGCASGPGGPEVPYLFTPSGKGPFPAVIVLHAKGGLSPHDVDFARDLTRQGFLTAVVDYAARGGVDNVEKAYDLLSANPAVSPGRIGLVGFSRGAEVAIKFSDHSHRFTERRVGAIVAYYLGASSGNNSERLPPILFLHGSLDVHFSPERIRSFCDAQTKMGATCEAEIFDRVKHAFDQVSTEYDGYDARATAAAYKLAVSFLGRHLKGP
jgi:carboxymethylenebutenolidase